MRRPHELDLAGAWQRLSRPRRDGLDSVKGRGVIRHQRRRGSSHAEKDVIHQPCRRAVAVRAGAGGQAEGRKEARAGGYVQGEDREHLQPRGRDGRRRHTLALRALAGTLRRQREGRETVHGGSQCQRRPRSAGGGRQPRGARQDVRGHESRRGAARRLQHAGRGGRIRPHRPRRCLRVHGHRRTRHEDDTHHDVRPIERLLLRDREAGRTVRLGGEPPERRHHRALQRSTTPGRR